MNEQRSEALKKELHDKTWRGDYWSKDGAISLALRLYGHNVMLGIPKPESALSSTYYSAAGNAYARAVKAGLCTKIFWYLRAYGCLHKAVVLSNRLAHQVGLDGMTYDELDIRASIMYKNSDYRAACASVLKGLAKLKAEKDASPDSELLLTLTLGKVLKKLGNLDASKAVFKDAELLIPRVSPKTSVRYYRALAEHQHEYDPAAARKSLNIATEIALEHHLDDQVAKIGALFDLLIK